MASLCASLLMFGWIMTYMRGYAPHSFYPITVWHSHEMLFGYTSAVIAGFLLTAVQNWTELPTLQGKSLAAIVAVWLSGRVLPYFTDIFPSLLVTVIDVGFLPILAVSLVSPILRKRKYKNLIFVPVVFLLALANLLTHLEVLGLSSNTATTGTKLALNVIVLLMVIVGGRVIPFFTEKAIPEVTIAAHPIVDVLTIAPVVALLIVELFVVDPVIIVGLTAVAATMNGLRLFLWHTPKIWQLPILWVLYTGYGWLILGFVLKSAAILGSASPALAIHAFTVGGIGVLTTGMMVRVTLGHTGRPLKPHGAVVFAFLTINLAAVFRVVLPIITPQHHVNLVAIAGVLWIGAFLTFLVVFTPMLVRPRLDTTPT